MALFKIFKGNQTENLFNSDNNPNYRAPVDGYAYYDTSSKLLYIDADYSANGNGTITREPINAYSALRDGIGNIIESTYATKLSISGTTLKLQNTAGTDLSSVTLPSGYVSTTGSKGDILYWSASNTPTHLTNASSTTKKFLSITSQVPSWVTLAKGDVGLGNVENKSSATIRGELTSSNVTTALGFTPYNATNPSGYTTNTGTVTKVTAGTGLSIGTTAQGNFTTTGTINHTNSITAQTTQALYPIKIDACGHISAYGTAVTSLPASDVSSWAKASTKPSYTATEVGLGNVSNNSNLNNISGAKGDIIYWSANNTPAHLSNTSSTTKQFLSIVSQVPSWGALVSSDIITALGFTPYDAANASGYTAVQIVRW